MTMDNSNRRAVAAVSSLCKLRVLGSLSCQWDFFLFLIAATQAKVKILPLDLG
jgi:hypothetical protein